MVVVRVLESLHKVGVGGSLGACGRQEKTLARCLKAASMDSRRPRYSLSSRPSSHQKIMNP